MDSLVQTATALFGIFTLIGGGYGAGLLYIRKLHERALEQYQKQLEDKDATIAQLVQERDKWVDLAFQSVQATEHVASTSARARPTR